uniref:Uncharacterized protein n=1 Tax=Phaeocystis cordata TaxID=118079 RepID=A0A7S1N0A5_9EUKA|mmetsp:Transcript_3294/g.7280  ORF Transcript_3294/g.7280 Transcript_3294/m.7280 type:complete len:194 (-) Transcript_3294:119-700(-)
MEPVLSSTLSSFVFEKKESSVVGEKRSLKREEESKPKNPRPTLKGKRQRPCPILGRQAGSFGVVLVNGQVRISTAIFILCLLEAILWSSCLVSSHSALKTDNLEAEHYLLRETENLKSSLNYDGKQAIPAYKQSYLAKQHIVIERLWAQRLRSLRTKNTLEWNTPKTRCNFQLEASILDKGIPGPFAGVNALH